jgi:hypothetical protein
MARTATEVIEDHLNKRLQGNVEEDIKANFAEDIVILSSYGTFRGHDGVRESADKLKKMLGKAEFAYNTTIIEGDYGFLEWSGRSGEAIVCDGADSFVVKGGLIVMQTIHYSAQSRY